MHAADWEQYVTKSEPTHSIGLPEFKNSARNYLCLESLRIQELAKINDDITQTN